MNPEKFKINGLNKENGVFWSKKGLGKPKNISLRPIWEIKFIFFTYFLGIYLTTSERSLSLPGNLETFGRV